MIHLAAGFFGELPLPMEQRDAVAIQFTLSGERLGPTEILNAGHASAGRLAAELLRRVRGHYPQARFCLAANPRLSLSRGVLQALILSAREQALAAANTAPSAWLLVDRLGQTPLGYMLRAEVLDWCPPAHLGLLTGDDVALEQQFLQASFGDCQLVRLPSVSPVGELAHGFFATTSPALYDFLRHAIARLGSVTSTEARRELVARGERIALIGFHAGDVLFLLQAMALEADHQPFTGVAVPTEYADIVHYLCPQLRCLIVKQPLPQRGGYHIVDEHAVLRDYVSQLASEGVELSQFFWHPLRPWFRDFARSRHHLREMTAMAIGGSGHLLRPLPPLSEASQRDYARARPLPGRVIVQFDAGWGLKGFPPDRRGELLRLLQDVGYDPLLLGPREPGAPAVASAPYTDLRAFRGLLDTAVAFIGCDSFPSHFANLYGIPTVTMFGSTRPSTARGMDGRAYRTLHHPMPCVPCNGKTHCLLDQGTSCYAMPTAGEVVQALQSMAAPPVRKAAHAQDPA